MTAEAQRTRDTVEPPPARTSVPSQAMPSEVPLPPIPPRPTAAPRRVAPASASEPSASESVAPQRASTRQPAASDRDSGPAREPAPARQPADAPSAARPAASAAPRVSTPPDAPEIPPVRPAPAVPRQGALGLRDVSGPPAAEADRTATDGPAAPAVPPRPAVPPPPPSAPPSRPAEPGAARPAASGAPSAEAPAAPAAPEAPAPRGFAGLPRAGLGRVPARAAAIGACFVLGLGLLGGAAAGAWLHADASGATAATFGEARSLWHTLPVDTIFPRTLYGEDAGPGKADRTWTRIAVAPDSGCAGAFDPLLAKALSPVGCERLLRATYTDATSSNVTTVGLLVTEADRAQMRALQRRFASQDLQERHDLLPRPYAAKGTPAARFGPEQRASWSIRVLTDMPVVLYAVSGFADGRTVRTPEPAVAATVPGADSDAAQAGLGHDANGIADRIERGLRKASNPAAEDQQ